MQKNTFHDKNIVKEFVTKPALHRISERILRFNKPTSPSSKNSTKLGVVVHGFNASTQEAEAGEALSSRPA